MSDPEAPPMKEGLPIQPERKFLVLLLSGIGGLLIGLILVLSQRTNSSETSKTVSPIIINRQHTRPENRTVTYVAFGDSITKGVRPGVTEEEIYPTQIGQLIKERIASQVFTINAGVSGDTTSRGLLRLEQDVLAHRPDIVTIMFGTNDAFYDEGKETPRVNLSTYRSNLNNIINRLREQAIIPILMTSPRWSEANFQLNERLEPYIEVVRSLGRELKVPVIDHYAFWTTAKNDRLDPEEWTTDGCHPNKVGHQQLTYLISPVILGELIR